MVTRANYKTGYDNYSKEAEKEAESLERKASVQQSGMMARRKLADTTANLDPSEGLDPAPELASRFKKYREYANNYSSARESMISKINAEKGLLSKSPTESLMAKQASGENVGQRLVGDISDALGLTDVQAAGIAGNFDHETGGFKFMQELKPVVPGSKGGLGFAQWTGPRRKAFESWAKENNLDTNTYEANFGFFIHEVQNTNEGRFLEDLQEAETVEDSTRIFSEQYLRPGKPMMKSRLTRANTYLPGGQ